MNFGAILAGGTGVRMEKHNIPKQFIELSGKPIIVRTVEKMLKVSEFDYIYIAIHPNYEDFLKEILSEHNLLENSRIIIIHGGKERIDSIDNVIKAVSEQSGADDDVIVLHDAVRPFVSERVLKESIITARQYGACVAIVPAVDTMYNLDENGFINGFPKRQNLFNGQSPDSFRVCILKSSIDSLTEEERKSITGTVQICAAKGHKIATIKGDYKNIKITTENDLILAQGILKEEEKDESLCA